MVEVTKADRNLLAELLGYDSDSTDDIMAGNIFIWEATQIARHRIAAAQAERAAVVAELRLLAELAKGFADMGADGLAMMQGRVVWTNPEAVDCYNRLATAIEAGEHRA